MVPKHIIPDAVDQLFSSLPDAVRELAVCARRLLLTHIPNAIEFPDAKGRLIGYGYGAGYKDMVATLILSKVGVKIGLIQGASLADPASLMRGAGKVHRHIDIRTNAHLQRDEVRRLIEAGLNAWRQRSLDSKSGNSGKVKRS